MLFLNTNARIKKILENNSGPKTGLVAADFNGNKIYLYKNDGTKISITLLLGTNFFETDSTNSPGLYEFIVNSSNLDQEGQLSISFQPAASAFIQNFYIDTVSTSISTAIQSIKGTANLSNSDIGGALYNPSLDNLHAIKTAVNGISMSIAGAVWDELTASHISAGTYGEFVAILSAIFLNRVKIDYISKNLIVFQADNVTPLKTFALTDSAGNPATLNASERARAI